MVNAWFTSRRAILGNTLVAVAVAAVALLAWPDYGFTRGVARRPRQIQYLACPYFPRCHTRPVRKARSFLARPHRCYEHNEKMTEPVVWKPRTR
ncbi:hypothetical protein [Paractinoplanes brasiliensis]|uniref:Uncharacterized protein n=1 Tax=Paractinoplanes brasiliensis TaxID=52695 RepID=A0A4R6K2B6_9ACTN|nr:hypothetical protein [Actinoplanes brasiliensis]TDO42291.1 hypothetical protein C8E87_6058 [Actinoplanes brasiliensis]GID29518.1 hypothetical protein Abr02nite_45010 [Actinoplanes brasiliensis]